MDWKRLVQFALLGSSELEQYAIPLIRLSRKVTTDKVGLLADFLTWAHRTRFDARNRWPPKLKRRVV